MLTLRSAIDAHGPLLWIDSSSTRIQVGVLRTVESGIWLTTADEASVGIFSCAEKVLKEANLSVAALSGFVFCEGPGSVLGVRLAAMALRTWRVLNPKPIFSYSSLSLLAESLKLSHKGTSFSVIADARRDSWHRLAVNTNGVLSPLERTTAAELQGTLFTPEEFKHWAPLPPQTQNVAYRVPELLAQIADAPLLRETDQPDAFLHEEPSYLKWTPQVHRAPG